MVGHAHVSASASVHLSVHVVSTCTRGSRAFMRLQLACGSSSCDCGCSTVRLCGEHGLMLPPVCLRAPWHLQDVPPPVRLFPLAEVLTHLTPFLLPSGESLPSLALAHVYCRLGPHAFPRSLVRLPLVTPLVTLKPSWMFTSRLRDLTTRYMNYFSLGKTSHNYYKNK